MRMNRSIASSMRGNPESSEEEQAVEKTVADNPSGNTFEKTDQSWEAESISNQLPSASSMAGLIFFKIPGKIGNFILNHYKNHMIKKPWTFILRISIELLFITITVGFIIYHFFSDYNRNPFSNIPFWIIIIGALFFAPIFETFLFQSVPIYITTNLRKSFAIKLLSSVVPFALVHIAQGGLIGAVSGLIGGFYFAFSYVTWKEKIPEYAFSITACIHFVYNTAIIIFSHIFNSK